MSKPETPNPIPPSIPNPLASLADQLATMERHAIDRMKTSMHEATRLCADAFDYAVALSGHWRSFALDAVRRASQTPAP